MTTAPDNAGIEFKLRPVAPGITVIRPESFQLGIDPYARSISPLTYGRVHPMDIKAEFARRDKEWCLTNIVKQESTLIKRRRDLLMQLIDTSFGTDAMPISDPTHCTVTISSRDWAQQILRLIEAQRNASIESPEAIVTFRNWINFTTLSLEGEGIEVAREVLAIANDRRDRAEVSRFLQHARGKLGKWSKHRDDPEDTEIAIVFFLRAMAANFLRYGNWKTPIVIIPMPHIEIVRVRPGSSRAIMETDRNDLTLPVTQVEPNNALNNAIGYSPERPDQALRLDITPNGKNLCVMTGQSGPPSGLAYRHDKHHRHISTNPNHKLFRIIRAIVLRHVVPAHDRTDLWRIRDAIKRATNGAVTVSKAGDTLEFSPRLEPTQRLSALFLRQR